MLAYAGLDGADRGAPVLEVGAGTGKATLALAERGLAVTCLEPDPRMAAVLRSNAAERAGLLRPCDTRRVRIRPYQ